MYPFVKRFFDIVISILVLLVILPLLFLVGIVLSLSGEREVFYFQERVGWKNQLFSMWKFATMLKNSPEMKGGIITADRDPRVTKVGAYLRKTKINELPQIINVILGDMSLVGPRPVVSKAFAEYPETIKSLIYNVRPGVTGIGSVIFRNEAVLIGKVKQMGKDPWEFYKNEIYPYKGQLESWYQEKQSFATDFFILILTVWVLFFPGSTLHYRVFPTLPRQELFQSILQIS